MPAVPDPVLLHGAVASGATPILVLLLLAAFVFVMAAVISNLQR